jgi:hypothetical protein
VDGINLSLFGSTSTIRSVERAVDIYKGESGVSPRAIRFGKRGFEA